MSIRPELILPNMAIGVNAVFGEMLALTRGSYTVSG